MRLVLLAGSLAASASAASSSSGGYCTVTDQVVLTTCDACVTQDQGCVQYPSKAADKCSDAARNACKAHDASCTYQCLNVYQGQSGKWTLFIKTPEATDAFVGDPNGTFPVAPVQRISGLQVPELANAIQIAGFTSVNSVPKGSTKTLVLDNNFFANAQSVNSLAVANINLAQLQTNFLPKTLSTLVMDNCALTDVPYDVRSMQSLTTLNLTSNNIVELPSADSTTFKGIQGLTSLSVRGNALTSFNWVLPSLTFLDLGNNKLTTFPTSIFNMTKLTTVILDGNDIKATTLTSAQFSFFKRLSATSSLGFSAAPGSCGTGEREDSVLGAVVCVSDASNGSGSTTTPKSSSSSNLGLIIGIVAAAVVVLAVGGFLVYRRRSKTNSQFYDAVMDNRSGTGTRSGGSGTRSGAPGGNYNHTGNNTGASATGESRGSLFGRMRGSSTGRRSSVQGNRPSRANSSGSRPSLAGRPSKTGANSSVYAEIGKYQEERQTGTATGGTSSLAVGGSRQRERAQINKNVVRISSEDINYTRTIAKGAFGEVWLAHYGRDLVAVKKLLSTDPSSVGDFIAELNLLASLSHPRILALIGACWDDNQSDLQIVTEYMDSGDLLTVLRRSSPRELTWEKHKATYCVQVCEAVFYLHSLQPALIHRDIKSRNILIDERKGAKLSDFGESRERTIQNTMTAGVGTARWVAPEIILGEDYSELADIYSLGVLLTELDTHKIPFESLNLEEHMIVQQVAVGKLRPTVSDTCPEVIRRLAHECLQFDPQLRPSAARVLQTLMASPLIRRLSTISDNE